VERPILATEICAPNSISAATLAMYKIRLVKNENKVGIAWRRTLDVAAGGTDNGN
jgi:hypothetical protein